MTTKKIAKLAREVTANNWPAGKVPDARFMKASLDAKAAIAAVIKTIARVLAIWSPKGAHVPF